MLQKKKQTIPSCFKRPGFTLAELILVVALTLFLLTVTVQGFVNSASQFSFNNAADKIQEMIRTARSYAINGKAQLDYTDYNKNGCYEKDDPSNASGCNAQYPQGDLVTPAHYGVNFQKTTTTSGTPPVSVDTYTVTLFADNHEVPPNPPKEGKYDYKASPTLSDYKNGYDIVLDQFVLPAGMKLIIPKSTDGTTTPGDGGSATIFFSPIFADVSSDITIPSSDPFFRFGISQSWGNILRKRCSEIHLLAGISEPMSQSPSYSDVNCP